jgi:hypothetical protein
MMHYVLITPTFPCTQNPDEISLRDLICIHPANSRSKFRKDYIQFKLFIGRHWNAGTATGSINMLAEFHATVTGDASI